MSEEKPHSMLDVQKNVMTKTLCHNSTKSDWDTATQDDKEYLVGYCTGRLNMRTGKRVGWDDMYQAIDRLFKEDSNDSTTFLDNITKSYRIFQERFQP